MIISNKQKNHSLYQKLLSSNIIIDGIYDDHDIGVNDADNRLSKSIQKESQQLLLDFLDINKNHQRRQRDGAYSVHKIDDIMIIMLDTRTHRSPTTIPSIGKWEYPFTAFIASYIRYLTAYFGLINNNKSSQQILDQKQWDWFKDILKSQQYQTSNLVLIISSTQIFTSNPYFESWGHFPSEKRKLLKLINDYSINNKDQHILFISGDVHHSELIYGDEEYGPLEVTSSGMTHSLNGMYGLSRLISLHITDTYHPYHRTKYVDPSVKNGYYGKNFAMIEIVKEKNYNLKIYDAQSGENVINVPLNYGKKSSIKKVIEKMNNDKYIYFPRKYPFYGLEIVTAPILLLCAIIFIFSKCKTSKRKTKRDKQL